MKRFKFTSFDNTELSAYRKIAKNEKAVIHIIHGASDRIARYKELIEFLSENNISSYGIDLRSHGENDKGKKLVELNENDSENIIKDTISFYKYIKEQTDNNIFLLGHSMGSYIAQNIAFYNLDYHSYFFIGSGYISPLRLYSIIQISKLVRSVKGKNSFSKLLESFGIGGLVKSMYKKGLIKSRTDWLTSDPKKQQEFKEDQLLRKRFSVQSNIELYKIVLNAMKKDNIKNIANNKRYIFMSGTLDPLGGYTTSVKKLSSLYQANSNAKIRLVLYDNMRHEILNEMDRLNVYEKILEFMGKDND